MWNKKSYISHLDGLKGFACIMVMIGHFIGFYKYAEYFPERVAWLDSFLNSQLSFIVDETFYVKLFFIVSGYLVSLSMIDSKSKLMKKCVHRFVRLGLPILFAYAIIWGIYQVIGFHTMETESILANTWIQSMYGGEFRVVEVFTSPFDVLILNKTGWNSPYWVLRDMFIASLIIYALSYLRKCIKKEIVLVFITAGLFVGSIVVSDVACACFVGMLLYWFEMDYKNTIEKKWFPYVIILSTLALYVASRAFISYLFFCALIVFIPRISWVNRLFSSKAMLLLGKISFGIYSFHWPVFCSLGMIVFIKSSEIYGPALAVLVSSVCTTIVTAGISTVYYYVFERGSYKLMKKMGI